MYTLLKAYTAAATVYTVTQSRRVHIHSGDMREEAPTHFRFRLYTVESFHQPCLFVLENSERSCQTHRRLSLIHI